MEKETERTELSDFSKTLGIINKTGLIALAMMIPGSFIVGSIFNTKPPTGLILFSFLFVVAISIYLYLMANKVKTLADFRRLCMFYFSAVVIFLTVLIHYLGGIEGGLGLLFYSFVIMEISIILSPRQGMIITALAVLSFSVLALMEYSGIVPHYTAIVGTTSYSSLKFLIITLAGGGLLGLSFTSFAAGRFSHVYRRVGETLEKEREELIKTRSELEEAKNNLEVRVRARTEELEKLTENLEGQVKQRTKELQGKLEELEKFQKFAVDREIKMVELKKELEENKKETEK